MKNDCKILLKKLKSLKTEELPLDKIICLNSILEQGIVESYWNGKISYDKMCEILDYKSIEND